MRYHRMARLVGGSEPPSVPLEGAIRETGLDMFGRCGRFAVTDSADLTRSG